MNTVLVVKYDFYLTLFHTHKGQIGVTNWTFRCQSIQLVFTWTHAKVVPEASFFAYKYTASLRSLGVNPFREFVVQVASQSFLHTKQIGVTNHWSSRKDTQQDQIKFLFFISKINE